VVGVVENASLRRWGIQKLIISPEFRTRQPVTICANRTIPVT
jgi:hypothetical protein